MQCDRFKPSYNVLDNWRTFQKMRHRTSQERSATS